VAEKLDWKGLILFGLSTSVRRSVERMQLNVAVGQVKTRASFSLVPWFKSVAGKWGPFLRVFVLFLSLSVRA
jgi:hypothetical protein